MASDYFVSPFNADHNECTCVAKVTTKQVIDMEQTRAATDSNPHVSAKVFMSQVHNIEGVKVGQRMAYRARDVVVEESSGDYQCSCQDLHSLLQNLRKAILPLVLPTKGMLNSD
ncbi:hypothetical protein PF005_g8685 [Phytophthora fragariae]|uniref:Uncharacterized protein n=2 Tax=Phytophthora TaxID=4783 RepID=A0A6A4E627_9STRA|nr:hypothetical protein PF003_g35744 [Phytophthora fragariae]KAE9002900.1 hypothetical protein PR002_g17502 [Phytophthora rubi]KAE8942779.1 hypothetical protein PF009_g7465 [Phytophthora fragariae]KAE9017219.1 hypothetical protein PF011_g6796 [Phytophthora fragariae]KAE9087371.1 hypothetical protein PF010_g19752 [Phytophthora fragariae]